MSLKIGIDVGGTFTDFFVDQAGHDTRIHKTLSTPSDPSIAVIQGLTDIAEAMTPPMTLEELAANLDTIVHGTTVTTNATLTSNGAKCGLITTEGLRDALEMRRGIREEQYNNRCTNVVPLVPRYLRRGVGGRLDRNGREIAPLSLEDVRAAIDLFKAEEVKAVAICFMNSFTNGDHEERAAELVRELMPEAYLTVSSDLLPSIRFYERVSTTALNSYIGPILDHYLNQLLGRLDGIGFKGILLIMQSNGGVMTPQIARDKAALTLLSGPAAGPGAGLQYVKAHDQDKCIVVDMGGTSFEASLVVGTPIVVNEGEIDRRRLALPMLGIHTIGAGGGSVGWLDEGGLLRMGPESAGAAPGPASYMKGGTKPACTDANLVLGYLDPDFFAGGSMRLDMAAARKAIEEHVAIPMGFSIEEAAAGMYRIACTNMAQGIREITIKRGFDPREFPLVVAGGAGPTHSCLICEELQIPFQIIPRESSILCAAGMLMSDLRHDFVRTFVARLKSMDWAGLNVAIAAMLQEGNDLLEEEDIPPARRSSIIKLDCRYLRQYHEVSVEVSQQDIESQNTDSIAAAFHLEHNRLFGYSLEDDADAPVEIINIRVQSVGEVAKPTFRTEEKSAADATAAIKGERSVYIPEDKIFRVVSVYDGHKMSHGHHVEGPAMIEQVTTAIFVDGKFNCVIDKYGSFALYRKDRPDLVTALLEGEST
ncbi:N-methylhydantoinase A [hydrothermal vent metagenome]|uniref:N-methylhydantoinase A n=1 Tax=hydrothermal vent metagenome TaxID=652676 RepID=A0A3B1B8B5_9ZZZZ